MTELQRSEVQDALLKGLLAAEMVMSLTKSDSLAYKIHKKRCKEIDKALEIVRYL